MHKVKKFKEFVSVTHITQFGRALLDICPLINIVPK